MNAVKCAFGWFCPVYWKIRVLFAFYRHQSENCEIGKQWVSKTLGSFVANLVKVLISFRQTRLESGQNGFFPIIHFDNSPSYSGKIAKNVKIHHEIPTKIRKTLKFIVKQKCTKNVRIHPNYRRTWKTMEFDCRLENTIWKVTNSPWIFIKIDIYYQIRHIRHN